MGKRNAINSKQKGKKKLRGFSMIEAVVAIFICGISFVIFISVLFTVVKAEFYKRDQIIAAGLAQEGIEIVRNIRDNNLRVPGVPKKAFDSPFPSSGRAYCVNYNGDYSSNSPATGSCIVEILSATTKTTFWRGVSVTGSGDQRVVASVVVWRSSGSTVNSRVQVNDTLYSWGNNE